MINRRICLALALLAGCAGSPPGSGEQPAAASPRASSAPAFVPLKARANAPFHVGFERLQLARNRDSRPLLADLWYPVDPSIPEAQKAYLLAKGRVAEHAQLATGLPKKLPLVILSHGSGGTADDYPWLTETLAAHGYLVLGVHHFGESRAYGFATVDPKAILRFWLRPRDVERAYARFLELPKFGALVDLHRVYGVGHSAGGHTILAAAGVAYDPKRLGAYCTKAPPASDRGCMYATTYGHEEPKPGELTDPNAHVPFSGLVLFDPALGPSFATADLSAFRTPVRLFATDPGDFLPFGPHAGHLAESLPNVELTRLIGAAGHFVFLGECSLTIEVMGLPLCKDAPGVDRHAVHQDLAQATLTFLAGLSHDK